jgi:hypothetical protein
MLEIEYLTKWNLINNQYIDNMMLEDLKFFNIEDSNIARIKRDITISVNNGNVCISENKDRKIHILLNSFIFKITERQMLKIKRCIKYDNVILKYDFLSIFCRAIDSIIKSMPRKACGPIGFVNKYNYIKYKIEDIDNDN